MISQLMQNPPPPPPPPPPLMGPPPVMAPYQQPYAGQRVYAGFWIRLVARLIDGFIIGILLVVIGGLIAIVSSGLVASSGGNDQSANNAAAAGAPLGIGGALVRWLMTLVNTWACYLGWIWVAIDVRKQGWHDKVANSVVLQG